MRLVLDTNTAVSGLIWGGVPGRLIDAAVAGKFQVVSSLPLLDELQGVLLRRKFVSQLAEQDVHAADLFEGYAARVHLFDPAEIGPVILADPDDRIALAAATKAGGSATDIPTCWDDAGPRGAGRSRRHARGRRVVGSSVREIGAEPLAEVGRPGVRGRRQGRLQR